MDFIVEIQERGMISSTGGIPMIENRLNMPIPVKSGKLAIRMAQILSKQSYPNGFYVGGRANYRVLVYGFGKNPSMFINGKVDR